MIISHDMIRVTAGAHHWHQVMPKSGALLRSQFHNQRQINTCGLYSYSDTEDGIANASQGRVAKGLAEEEL